MFSICVLRRLNFKGIDSDKSRGKSSKENLRKKKGKIGEIIIMGVLSI